MKYVKNVLLLLAALLLSERSIHVIACRSIAFDACGSAVVRRSLVETPAATYEVLALRAHALPIHMMAIPGGRKYLVVGRNNTAEPGMTAGTLDLDTNKTTKFNPGYQHFCSGVLALPDGRPLLVGGHTGNAVQEDGRDVISVYNDTAGKSNFFSRMRYQRWYATPCRLPNDKILIVGGTLEVNKGPTAPYAEILDPANPAAQPPLVVQPKTFAAGAGLNWYPLIQLLPRGEVLWWGDRRGSITDTNWRLITDLPPLPATYPFKTMYKGTASVAPLALRPDANGQYTRFGFIFFGGNRPGSTSYSRASSFSVRLDLWYCNTTASGICNGGWIIEDMLNTTRVLGDAVVLPNGRILVHGGASAGNAGQKDGNNVYGAYMPVPKSLMYDPAAPLGSRYSRTENIGIARMYHSSTCLDPTGKVLAAGCDSCGVPLYSVFSPSPDGDEDYRLSMATPVEIGRGIVRPVITAAPSVITRGTIFNVSYNYDGRTITGASLVAPCTNTHSTNFNSRVVFLPLVSAANGTITLRAPPASQPAVALWGPYLLFLIGEPLPPPTSSTPASLTGTAAASPAPQPAGPATYSEGRWLRLRDAASPPPPAA